MEVVFGEHECVLYRDATNHHFQCVCVCVCVSISNVYKLLVRMTSVETVGQEGLTVKEIDRVHRGWTDN